MTGPDDTDFMIFHCSVVEGERRLPTLFLVDYDTPGVVMQHDPDYTHTFADRHPQFVLDDVRVPAAAVLGGVGQADELTNEWFVEERIHIGARCAGRDGAAARRSPSAWATERVQFGERIYDFQGVSFPLADSAADASAARLLTRECAWLADTGADPKVVHAKASLAKLFASEAAWRCADRVVQVFGGRGYMREFAAERFLRELRVDRIWEGTSEIQRMIIARALEKRGVGRVVGMTETPTERALGRHRPAAAVRAGQRGRRRGVAAIVDRRDRPRQPARDGQRDPLPLRQPEVRRAARPALLSVAGRAPRAARHRDRGAQPVACRVGHRGGRRGRRARR